MDVPLEVLVLLSKVFRCGVAMYPIPLLDAKDKYFQENNLEVVFTSQPDNFPQVDNNFSRGSCNIVFQAQPVVFIFGRRSCMSLATKIK